MGAMNSDSPVPRSAETAHHERFLFAACFAALVATSFAFMIRVMAMDQWQIAFGLSETQKGEIFGAGMWPFGISIVLFSLIIDRVGYGRSMIFAFVCHLASTVLLITANGYWGLYIGSFLNGLAAGTVEAVINPAVATMYPKQKTKMLTILHAGWPGGMVLSGILILVLTGAEVTGWKVQVAVILIPVILYGLMLLKCKFPVSERVAAGVPYRDMLREAGAIGWLIVVYLITMEVNRLMGLGNLYDGIIDLPSWQMLTVLIVLVGAYYAYTRSCGRPMYLFLLLVMILLAITELGTDTWIRELMKPAMTKLGLDAGLVLVYTATIMMVLRFCIGPIEKLLKPLGVLFVSSLFAALGLYSLSRAEGPWILLMATIYGTGQCFFWPVTLGLIAERFPRGGALTLNAIAGVGMLGVGILGSQLLGYWQDTRIDTNLQAQGALYTRLMSAEPKESIFGGYKALNRDKVNEINDKVALYEHRQKVGAGEGEVLASDAMYRTLVLNAYSHLVGAGSEEMSHSDMHAALAQKGAFVDAQEYAATVGDKGVLGAAVADAQRNAMATIAILPLIMAVCYLGLILYFRAHGGYKPIDLMAAADAGTGDAAVSVEEKAEPAARPETSTEGRDRPNPAAVAETAADEPREDKGGSG